MPYAAVCFEVATTCPKCRKPLPINGAAASVLCSNCRTPMPTPPEMWRALLGGVIGEALAMPEGTVRKATYFVAGAQFDVTFGREAARCGTHCAAPLALDHAPSALSSGSLACGTCGRPMRVRIAPPWLREVHGRIAMLVGETLARSEVGPERADVPFHCYHCGGALPLDGSKRRLHCGHCGKQITVPDEVWAAFHPEPPVDRWYVLLDVDVASVGLLPETAFRFLDIAVEPGAQFVVAWQVDAAPMPNRTRVALADREGLLRWEQRDVDASDEARLATSPFDGSVWLIDPTLQRATVLDSRTGRVLRVHQGDLAAARPLSIDDGRAFAIDWDGSFLVGRDLPHVGRALVRFDAEGRPLETWPDVGRTSSTPGMATWDGLSDHPGVLPAGALIAIGWDGCVYAASPDGRRVAKMTRRGELLGVLTLPAEEIDRLHALAASRDGVLHLLHSAPGARGARVSRISPTGQFARVMSPESPAGAPRMGAADDRLKLLPDGTMFVAQDFDSLRVIGPDLARLFVSNATRRFEKAMLADDASRTAVTAVTS